jgi:hypothetical protein
MFPFLSLRSLEPSLRDAETETFCLLGNRTLASIAVSMMIMIDCGTKPFDLYRQQQTAVRHWLTDLLK